MKYYYNNYEGDKMKVFISWSGERSLKVAETLKEWIPCVIQGIDPYLSSADIDKGARWSTDIAQELELADFGILCVTKDNINSSWLNFEAGALSKAIDKAKVCPFLFNLMPSDISNSPILQFQMTNVDRADIYKLFQSMNSCMEENRLSEELLKKMFELSWSNIDGALKKIETSPPGEKGKKTESNQLILEEMLDLLRSQQMLLRNPEQLLPGNYLNSIIKRDRDEFRYAIASEVPSSLMKEQYYIERKLKATVEEFRGDMDIKYREVIALLEDYMACNRHIFNRLGLKRGVFAGGKRISNNQLSLDRVLDITSDNN